MNLLLALFIGAFIATAIKLTSQVYKIKTKNEPNNMGVERLTPETIKSHTKSYFNNPSRFDGIKPDVRYGDKVWSSKNLARNTYNSLCRRFGRFVVRSITKRTIKRRGSSETL